MDGMERVRLGRGVWEGRWKRQWRRTGDRIAGVNEQGMGTCERHHEGGVRWGERVHGGSIMCTGAIRLKRHRVRFS